MIFPDASRQTMPPSGPGRPGVAPGLDRPAAIAVLLAVAALAAAVFLPAPLRRWCALGVAVIGGVSALSRRRAAALTALLSALSIAGLSVRGLVDLWPAPLLLALGVTALAASASGPGALPWLRRGEWTRAVSLRVIVTVLVASAALLVWFHALRPDVSDVKAHLPQVPSPWLVAMLVSWACLNALAEELVFRGALMHALEAAVGARAALGFRPWRSASSISAAFRAAGAVSCSRPSTASCSATCAGGREACLPPASLTSSRI